MNHQKFSRLLALLSALILLVGCAKFPTTDNTLTVTDALDRVVSVPKRPARVAALLGSFADVWILAGGTLCAAPEDAWEDFELDLPDAVNLGGAHSPSLEKLLSAAPDLVIASASTASNVELRGSLEAVGIPTLYFDVDNFDDYLNMLRTCTTITERNDLYEQHGTALKTKIEAVKARYADTPEEKRRILLLRASSTVVKAKGSHGTILGEMLRDMGCINIADCDTHLLETLSVESILKQAPHHIFVVTMGSDTAAATAAFNLIQEDPAWRSLDAVSGNRVHVMEKRLFNLKPNAHWAEAYQTLYETLT